MMGIGRGKLSKQSRVTWTFGFKLQQSESLFAVKKQSGTVVNLGYICLLGLFSTQLNRGPLSSLRLGSKKDIVLIYIQSVQAKPNFPNPHLVPNPWKIKMPNFMWDICDLYICQQVSLTCSELPCAIGEILISAATKFLHNVIWAKWCIAQGF